MFNKLLDEGIEVLMWLFQKVEGLKQGFFAGALLLASLLSAESRAEVGKSDVTLLASIKPLQLIAQAVTKEAIATDVLLPVGATPHDYAMKPSDLMRLNEADLVLWLGADWEFYLAKPMTTFSGIEISVLSEGLSESHGNHEEHHGHNDGHGHHGHEDGDPHIWFSPVEALEIAHRLVDELVKLDGENAAQYHSNLEAFEVQLQKADSNIRDMLSKSVQPSYLVYHDAYSFFEQHFELSHTDVVSLQAEVKPGVKHILDLRRLIETKSVSCLLAEPQASADIIALLTEDAEIQVAMLDPMASDIEVTETGYVEFLTETATKMAECF